LNKSTENTRTQQEFAHFAKRNTTDSKKDFAQLFAKIDICILCTENEQNTEDVPELPNMIHTKNGKNEGSATKSLFYNFIFYEK